MFNFLFNKIWGENPLTFYFSFDGRFNQLQLWGALITINLFCEVVEAQNIVALTAIASFVAFGATLAGIQKRCRDLNHKGTIITLVYTGTFLLYPKFQNMFGVALSLYTYLPFFFYCSSLEEKRKSRIQFLPCSNAHIYISEFAPSFSCSGGV